MTIFAQKAGDRMGKGALRRSVLFVLLFCLSALIALAQANPTGRLTGTVTDQRGGAIPEARILENSRCASDEKHKPHLFRNSRSFTEVHPSA
jgi:hypothetical protein